MWNYFSFDVILDYQSWEDTIEFPLENWIRENRDWRQTPDEHPACRLKLAFSTEICAQGKKHATILPDVRRKAETGGFDADSAHS